MKKTLAIDWLQCRVVMMDMLLMNIPDIYQVKLRGHGSQQFGKIYDIFSAKNNDLLAIITADPRPALHMQPNEGILQITNKYLYNTDLLNFLKKILTDLSLSFQNYTRLDFALDFENFDTIDVQNLITKIENGNYLKKRKVKWQRTTTVPRINTLGELIKDVETVSFGSKSSDIYYKLYNKSLEMVQKTHKEYIYNHWQSAGYDGILPVYRLEFTVKNSRKLIVTEDGEPLSYRDIDVISRANDIYWHVFNEHFSFVHHEFTRNNTNRKKDRSIDVVLFEDTATASCRIKPDSSKESKRSDKIFLKKVTKLNDELKQLHEKGDTWINLTMWGDMYGTYIARSRGLERWATDKLGYYRSDSELAAEMHSLMYNNVH
jgi:hypothetical protein